MYRKELNSIFTMLFISLLLIGCQNSSEISYPDRNDNSGLPNNNGTPTPNDDFSNLKQPLISPNGGNFEGTVDVLLTSETENATIYYTMDGSKPSIQSNIYNGAIEVTNDLTIQAIAVNNSFVSVIASADFKITPVNNNVQPPISENENNIPIANNDTVQTTQNNAISIDILSNDSGLEDGAIQLGIISSTLNGITTIQPDNTITYIPDLDYYGTDTFSYQITDVNNDTATASVSITISCSNCATNALLIEWFENLDMVDGYLLFAGPSSDDTSNLILDTAETSASVTSLMVNMQPGDTACFRLKSYKNLVESDFSQAMCTTI